MENFDNLKKTPLFEKHCALGGKIVDFGGWALPVQYTSILDECKAVRERAGLFDVSHMGEVDIIGNDAYAYMQKMVTNDVTSMTPGRCRYAVMCYDNGGAVDDVLIYKFADDHYMLIVNAGNTDKDFAAFSCSALYFAIASSSIRAFSRSLIPVFSSAETFWESTTIPFCR